MLMSCLSHQSVWAPVRDAPQPTAVAILGDLRVTATRSPYPQSAPSNPSRIFAASSAGFALLMITTASS